jgi:hypothetical protein
VYQGSPEENNIVEDFIQSTIQTKLDTYPDQLYVKNVEGINMVVKGKSEGPGTHPTTTETQKDGLALNIIIPIVAGVIFVIFVCVGWMWWGCQKKLSKSGGVSIGKTQTFDIEAARSTATEGSNSPTNIENANNTNPVVVDGQETVDKVVVEPVIIPPKVQLDPVAAGLPPRPPRRSSSTNLKKKRRKKKKKKVVVLKRVNSRENILEMPTISESGSEDDDESECDSDYTGDDDDGSASYDTSSGCITPVGSLSRSSSRASSPKLSPVKDSNDSNKTVVIEAPDFPHLWEDAFAKNAMKTKNLHTGKDRDLLPPLPPSAKRDDSKKKAAVDGDDTTAPKVDVKTVTRQRTSSLESDGTPKNGERPLSIEVSGTGGKDSRDEEKESPSFGLFNLPWLKYMP